MAKNKTDALFRKAVKASIELLVERAKARLLGRFYQGPRIVFQIVKDFGLENSLEGVYRHTSAHTLEPAAQPSEEIIEAQADTVNSVMESFKNRVFNDILDAAQTGSSKKIKEIFEKASDHMETIAAEESRKAQSLSKDEVIDKIARSAGIEDPTLFWVGRLDNKTCKHCLAMYHCQSDHRIPRVWKKSQLTQAYFKPKTWDSQTVHLNAHPRCFTGSQLLFTDHGAIDFKTLAAVCSLDNSGINVYTDNRIRKTKYNSRDKKVWLDRHLHGVTLKPASPVLYTGDLPCLRIHFSDGKTLEVSNDHEFWVDDGNTGTITLAKDLKEGNKIPISTDECGFGHHHAPELAELMGNCLGDGIFSEDHEVAQWIFFGDDIEYGRRIFDKAKKLSEIHRKGHAPYNEELTIISPDIKSTVSRAKFSSNVIFQLMKEIGFSKITNKVPDVLFQSDKETVASFLRGLYAADGHSEADFSIVLSQSDTEMLCKIQILLSMFGITSQIYKNDNESVRKFENDRLVKFGPCHRLVSRGYHNGLKFMSEIGLGVPRKQQQALDRLGEAEAKRNEKSKSRWRTVKITRIEDIGIQPTYCLEEPDTNTVIVNGIVTGQCRHFLTLLMPGFGFDDNGRVQYIGKGHDEYASQKQRGDT